MTLNRWFLCFLITLNSIFHGFSQVTFERQIPGTYATDVIRHPSGNYYALTRISSGYSIVYINNEGNVITSHEIISNTTSFYTNNFTDICVRKNGDIAAVGTEDEDNLVIFTSRADLSSPKIKKINGVSSGVFKLTATSDNGLAVLRTIPVGSGEWRLQLVRLNESLDIVSTYTFSEAHLYPQEIFETSTGTLVLACNKGNEGYVIRMSPGYTTKSFSGADYFRLSGAQMINDKLYLLGTTDNKTTVLVKFDANGNLTARNVIENTTETIYAPDGFAMLDDGRFMYTRMYSDGRKGFNLIVFNASAEKEHIQYYDRDFDWQGWTSFKAITATVDGIMMLVQVQSETIAMKTDILGVTGPPPPFTRITETGIAATDQSHFTWLDVNNDGHKELIVAGGDIKVYTYNTVDRTFKTVLSPFPKDVSDVRQLSLTDYDNDGDIDVYANRYFSGANGGYPYPEKNILFRNNGDATFTAIENLNINDPGSATLMSYWIDINKDGWIDLFTVNNNQDKAYLNNGNSTFTEMNPEQFETKKDWIYPTAYTWFDFNQDGYLDYIGNQNNQTDIMLNINGDHFEKHAFLEFFDIGPAATHINIGEFVPGYYNDKLCMIIAGGGGIYFEYEKGIFEYKDFPAGLEYRNTPTRGEFIDFDLDGDLDVYLSGNGWDEIKNDIFNRNDNNKGFTYYRKYSGWSNRSFTFYDLDENGATDLIGTNSNTQLLKNLSTGNYIKIRLQGIASPSFGAGATISVKTDGKWKHETLSMHGGQNGKIEYEALFTLVNTVSAVDSMKIQWPSGCTTVRTNIGINQIHNFTEDCTGSLPQVSSGYSVCAGSPLAIDILSEGQKFLWFKSLASEAIAESGRSIVIDTLTQSTTFFVSNADSVIHSRKVPIHITVLPLPHFDISSTIIQNDVVEFTITSQQAVSATTWSVNGEVASHENNFVFTNTTSKPIQICAVATFEGCTLEKCYESIVTGNEQSEIIEVDLFPNPCDERLTLKSTTGDLFTVTLYDATGRTILTDSGRTVYVFDTSLLKHGLYFVKVNHNKYFKVIRK